jgi:hypothetical protein
VRRIYSITAAGEAAFQDLLRENLSSYIPAQFGGDIGLAFMDALAVGERNSLLTQRRADLTQKLAEVEAVPIHPGNFQLMIEHQLRHLRAERDWLDEVILRLQ